MIGYRLFLAWIYDVFVLACMGIIYGFIAILFHHGQAIPAHTPLFNLCLLLIILAYSFLSLYYRGQTIGLRAWNLHYAANNDSNITVTAIFSIIYLMSGGWGLAGKVARCVWKNP